MAKSDALESFNEVRRSTKLVENPLKSTMAFVLQLLRTDVLSSTIQRISSSRKICSRAGVEPLRIKDSWIRGKPIFAVDHRDSTSVGKEFTNPM